jgi:hypothetical protein
MPETRRRGVPRMGDVMRCGNRCIGPCRPWNATAPYPNGHSRILSRACNVAYWHVETCWGRRPMSVVRGRPEVALRVRQDRCWTHGPGLLQQPGYQRLAVSGAACAVAAAQPEDTRSGPSRHRCATNRQRARSHSARNRVVHPLFSGSPLSRVANQLAIIGLCGDLPPVGFIVGYFGGRNGFGSQPVAHAAPGTDVRQRTTERSGN